MNIFNNARAGLLSALLVAGVIASGVACKAHAEDAPTPPAAQAEPDLDTKTWQLPVEERRMTPVHKKLEPFYQKMREAGHEVAREATLLADKTTELWGRVDTPENRQKLRQGWDYSTEKFSNLFVAKPAPRPDVPPYRAQLPAACPSQEWRKLEDFGFWLNETSPRLEAPVVNSAIDEAMKSCGKDAVKFKTEVAKIDEVADKYFIKVDAASKAFTAIGNLVNTYGETSAAAVN